MAPVDPDADGSADAMPQALVAPAHGLVALPPLRDMAQGEGLAQAAVGEASEDGAAAVEQLALVAAQPAHAGDGEVALRGEVLQGCDAAHGTAERVRRAGDIGGELAGI